MTTDKGVWGLQQVRDKQLQSLWTYSAPGGDAGKLFAWGNNENGQLGQNNTTRYSSPVQIAGTNWSSKMVGLDGNSNAHYASSFSVIKYDGTLWSWGENEHGRLGDNTSVDKSSPVQIPGTTWESIAGEVEHRAAIKTDGTLWVWGYNIVGQLGLNSTTQYASPVQVPGTTWSKVSCGYRSTMATKTDGTLWLWGVSSDGSSGTNQPPSVQYSSPTQIPGTTWQHPYRMREFSGAIKTDGTLWMWGRGYDGATGQNNRTDVSSPIQVPGTWKEISGGTQPYVVAVKTDGTAWGWGNGRQGQLGQNQGSANIYYSSPTQIGTDTTWNTISAGYYASVGTKTDGTLWTWGNNTNISDGSEANSGALGLNDRTSRSSPTQVGSSTQWSQGAMGGSWGIAFEAL